MIPALEYFVRTDLVKELFSAPCSLFLARKKTREKLVVVVSEEFKPNENFNVKHWHIATCQPEQVLPSISEYHIPKRDIFSSEYVIVKDYNLLSYAVEPICFATNSFNHPMSEEFHDYWVDSILTSRRHELEKYNWLWSEFVRIYMPQLSCSYGYITRSVTQIAEDQRKLVSQHLPRRWQCWLKWCRYMLDFPGVPAELIFAKEYDNIV